MDYLKGLGYLHENEFDDFIEEHGITEDILIHDLVYSGWSIGRDENMNLEFWED